MKIISEDWVRKVVCKDIDWEMVCRSVFLNGLAKAVRFCQVSNKVLNKESSSSGCIAMWNTTEPKRLLVSVVMPDVSYVNRFCRKLYGCVHWPWLHKVLHQHFSVAFLKTSRVLFPSRRS